MPHEAQTGLEAAWSVKATNGGGCVIGKQMEAASYAPWNHPMLYALYVLYAFNAQGCCSYIADAHGNCSQYGIMENTNSKPAFKPWTCQ